MKIYISLITSVTFVLCRDIHYKTIAVTSSKEQILKKGRVYRKSIIPEDQFMPLNVPYKSISEISCALLCLKDTLKICASFTWKEQECQLGHVVQNQTKVFDDYVTTTVAVFIDDAGTLCNGPKGRENPNMFSILIYFRCSA